MRKYFGLAAIILMFAVVALSGPAHALNKNDFIEACNNAPPCKYHTSGSGAVTGYMNGKIYDCGGKGQRCITIRHAPPNGGIAGLHGDRASVAPQSSGIPSQPPAGLKTPVGPRLGASRSGPASAGLMATSSPPIGAGSLNIGASRAGVTGKSR
jgi:hypothetical protein